MSIRQELIDRLTAFEDHQEALTLTGNIGGHPSVVPLNSISDLPVGHLDSQGLNKALARTLKGYGRCYFGDDSEILSFLLKGLADYERGVYNREVRKRGVDGAPSSGLRGKARAGL